MIEMVLLFSKKLLSLSVKTYVYTKYILATEMFGFETLKTAYYHWAL